MLDIVKAEPSGSIGMSYRRYIKSSFLPAVNRVVEILRNHSCTIEWPSVAWQKETFPARGGTEGAYI